MDKRYRPSNGTEGMWFNDDWCAKCANDAEQNGSKDYDDCAPHELCPIIANSMCYGVNDQEYPCEWIEDEDGPRCTTFVPFEPAE